MISPRKQLRTLPRRRTVNKKKNNSFMGFTLVELLVVVAIIGILAVATYVIIDPIEFFKKGRDTTRMNDLQTINTVIGVALQDANGSASQVLCNGATPPCNGSSNPSTTANRKIDGTGWVKVNMTGKSTTLTVLPVDPTNSGSYVYTYSTNAAGDLYELDAVLESKEYTVTHPRMSDDGGNNANVYETGTDLTILP